ncbi:MAG: hypothetical protein KDC84_01675 [Crocinitomicaceae bacterium]|nr:hypothetical protein [Crocinitomicaceae bacterium]
MRFNWLAILFVLFGTMVLGQNDPTVYRKEKIKYFEFEPFERSFTGVDESMDTLVQKDSKLWGYEDSLQYAINVAKLGDYSRAYNLLKKIPLKYTNNQDAAHLTMIYQLNQRYDIAEKWLKRFKADTPELKNAKRIWLHMIQLRKDLRDLKKNLKYETVFEIHDKKHYSEAEKNSDVFLREVIHPLEGGELVMRFHIQYIDQRDPVLAKLAVEMGDVIRQHLSLTMTYVAYSLGKHYHDSADNAKRVKAIKKEINDAKYEVIPLKNFFPKKRKSRFNPETIKELHKEENVTKYKLPPFEKEEEESFWMSKGFIVTTGLLVILLLVILFVKTRKK